MRLEAQRLVVEGEPAEAIAQRLREYRVVGAQRAAQRQG